MARQTEMPAWFRALTALLAVGLASAAAAAQAPGPAAAAEPAAAPVEPPRHPASEGPGSWFWPLQLDLPPSITPDARAAGRLGKNREEGRLPILVWTPPEAKRIRAILLVSPNTDSMSFAAHKAVRAVAAKRGMGIVYLRFCPHTGLMEKVPDDQRRAALETDRRNLQAILDKVAEKSGIVEYKYAPWIPLGK